MHSPLKLNMSEIFDRITLPTKTPQKYMLGGLKGGGRGGGSTSGGGAVHFCFVGFFFVFYAKKMKEKQEFNLRYFESRLIYECVNVQHTIISIREDSFRAC